MMSPVYWTQRARRVFATLARLGKASIRDLIAALGIEGETARSSLMQSLARWKGAGFVQADARAPRNYPRYALTPAGRQAWEGAVTETRAKVQGFFEIQVDTVSGTPVPSRLLQQGAAKVTPAPTPDMTPWPPSRIVDECPRCSTVITAKNLRQRLQRTKGFICETCGLELSEEARGFLDGISETGRDLKANG